MPLLIISSCYLQRQRNKLQAEYQENQKITFNAYVQCYKLINRKGKISLFASLEDQIADYQMRFQTTFSNEIPNNIFQNLNAKNCDSPKIK